MAFLMSMALSCSKAAEKSLVEKAIKGYNSALAQAYRDAELSYMEPYATKEQMERLKAVISPLKDKKHRMQIVQESFAIESITFMDEELESTPEPHSDSSTAEKDVPVKETVAEVVSQERWTFWYEDRESLKEVTAKETDSYRIIYTLKKQNGKWLVDRLTTA